MYIASLFVVMVFSYFAVGLVSGLCGGMASRNIGKRGAIVGAGMGVLLFLALYFMGLVVSGAARPLSNLPINLAVILGCSIIGGILGVNK